MYLGMTAFHCSVNRIARYQSCICCSPRSTLMQSTAIFPLLKQSYNEWTEDKASRLAAALAYYTAMSIAPLLVLAVTFLGWLQLNGRQVVESQMGQLMGSVGQQAAV